MNLQDILMKLSAYSIGCRIIDGNFLINITYDKGWKVIPPENNKIEFAQKGGITFYAAAINEVSFDDVFESIKETIDYNLDLQQKIALYKDKASELQNIFATESLDKLKTITFVFDKNKRPKRKYVRSKDKKQKDDIKDNVDKNVADDEKTVVSDNDGVKCDGNGNGNEWLEYKEYEGEELSTEDNNKVDYLEQLKNQ